MCMICAAFRPYASGCDYETLQAASNVTEGADAPHDNSSTYVMEAGGTFSGLVENPGDRDWIAIELTAGTKYDINLTAATSGTGTLSNPILAVYDANGIYIAGNDNGGAGAEAYLSFTPDTTGTYFVMGRGYSAGTGTYLMSVEEAVPPPPAPIAADIDTLARYLTDGYWTDTGSAPHNFDTSASNQITVNLDGLTEDGRQLARWALEAWEAVADLEFVETSGSAAITFDDEKQGASAAHTRSGSTTISVDVNVSSEWLDDYGTQIGSYGFQSYLHEIGHALGLGHQGSYDGAAVYGTDNTFINDSWQLSVMSYFSQQENTATDATYAETVSAMVVDVTAVQNLYGSAGAGSLSDGNTIYGAGHTLGSSWLGQLFDAVNGTGAAGVYDGSSFALTIYDTGGYDLIDFSGDFSNQTVDLESESVSGVYGETGNLYIARGTVIEHFTAGSGDDTVDGNSVNNVLRGNAGNDTLRGADGNDRLAGDEGDDILSGGTGDDVLIGGSGADTMDGGEGTDRAEYNASSSAIAVDLGNSANNAGAAAGDILTSIENLTATRFGDLVNGSATANVLKGLKGNDTMDGRGGDDTIIGAGGSDWLTGGTGDDTLRGGGRRDNLFGGDDADALFGNAGRDKLYGQGGSDTLTGGGGRDVFFFDGGADTIRDFANDRLRFDDALWGGTAMRRAEVADFASISGNSVVFDFGSGNTLTLEDYTALDSLASAIGIF